jgi:DNA recombination protein RmuC
MSIELLVVAGLIVVGFTALFWYLQKVVAKQDSSAEIEDVVNKVFGMSANKVAQQSKQILEGERQAIGVDLENKQKTIEKLIKQLQDDMAKRQEEIRGMEQDRSQKFGEITSALEHHRSITATLQATTDQLNKVLSNNQTRGAWGERIIEDIMHNGGLIENIHYVKQSKLGTTEMRPDVTLLLPDNKRVAVDVKFPYAEIQKMTEAESSAAKQAHLKQFGVDLKIKIKKVAEYIQPEQDTMDYAFMFVPNEMIFSFLNQKYSDLMDEAMQMRVIIVSPFTFVIVAKMVMESYRNFMIDDTLKDIIKHIDAFTKEWVMFKDEFEKFGRSIESLKLGYEKITTTRTLQMDRRIKRIAESQQGSLLSTSKEEPDLLG